MGYQNFKELRVWQEAKELAIKIYEITAKGSLSELRTQLEIAQGIGYLNQRNFEAFETQCNKLGAMPTKLIKSRKGN